MNEESRFIGLHRISVVEVLDEREPVRCVEPLGVEPSQSTQLAAQTTSDVFTDGSATGSEERCCDHGGPEVGRAQPLQDGFESVVRLFEFADETRAVWPASIDLPRHELRSLGLQG